MESPDSSVENILKQCDDVLARLGDRAVVEPEYSICRQYGVCEASGEPSKLLCRCGEVKRGCEPTYPVASGGSLHWHWKQDDRQLFPHRAVQFLPTHTLCHEDSSHGTVVLLGNRPLLRGWHHFFEIKILTDLYGTDTMVGVCTDRFDSTAVCNSFVSALGMDSHSWGYSFHGKVQYQRDWFDCGVKFGKGSVVGVYIDRYAGTLQFFLNRKSLGFMFTNVGHCDVTSVAIYPAFCTTAANTCIRLITAISVPDSLQLRSAKSIANHLPFLRFSLAKPVIRLAEQFPWQHYPPHPSCRHVLPDRRVAADFSSLITTPSPCPAHITTARPVEVRPLPFNTTSVLDDSAPAAVTGVASSPDLSFFQTRSVNDRRIPTSAQTARPLPASNAEPIVDESDLVETGRGLTANRRGHITGRRGLSGNGRSHITTRPVSDTTRCGLVENGHGSDTSSRVERRRGLGENGRGIGTSRRGLGTNGRSHSVRKQSRRLRVCIDSETSDDTDAETTPQVFTKSRRGRVRARDINSLKPPELKDHYANEKITVSRSSRRNHLTAACTEKLERPQIPAETTRSRKSVAPSRGTAKGKNGVPSESVSVASEENKDPIVTSRLNARCTDSTIAAANRANPHRSTTTRAPSLRQSIGGTIAREVDVETGSNRTRRRTMLLRSNR